MRVLFMLACFALSVANASAQPLRGTVEQRSFVDVPSGRTVLFNIYLPQGYASGTQEYPTIYHLHGLGGSQTGPQNTIIPRAFETAQTQGIIGPVIIVFPNGYTDAWWADSIGGDKPAETDVVDRLIPYVDAHFRTRADRGARVIQGFSMGGFGATKFYSKFPELFSVCIEYDGALLPWESIQQSHAGLAASIFGNDEEYFNQYSPFYWMEANAELLREGNAVRMLVGALVERNESFRDYLVGLELPVEYVPTICEHNIACLMAEQGVASAAFIAARLEVTCAADFDESGVVNSQDFFAFLGAFFIEAPLADFNRSGAVDSQDFFDFVASFFAGC